MTTAIRDVDVEVIHVDLDETVRASLLTAQLRHVR